MTWYMQIRILFSAVAAGTKVGCVTWGFVLTWKSYIYILF